MAPPARPWHAPTPLPRPQSPSGPPGPPMGPPNGAGPVTGELNRVAPNGFVGGGRDGFGGTGFGGDGYHGGGFGGDAFGDGFGDRAFGDGAFADSAFGDTDFGDSAFADSGPSIPHNPTRGRFPRAAAPGSPPERLFGRYRKIRSHSRHKHRVPVLLILVILVGVAIIGAALRYVPISPFAAHKSGHVPAAAPAPNDPQAPLPFRSAPVTAQSVKTTGFYSWALLDLRTGAISGSDNLGQPSTTAGLITAWFAADSLHRADLAGQTPTQAQLGQLGTMLATPDSSATGQIYQALGGDASIGRLVTACKLSDTKATPGDWKSTVVSARDTVRLGQCIATGAAAGSKWTPWLLLTLRQNNDSGLRAALPSTAQSDVAVANGFTRGSDKTWHVSCLAIGNTWAISVLQRFPVSGNDSADLSHTQQVCRQTAIMLRDNDVPLS